MRARRDELGDRAAFCPGCGWGRRFLAGGESAVPDSCPDCGDRILRACPACDAAIVSLMAITCPCGHALRDPDFFGRPIRRKAERHAGAAAPQCAGEVAAASDLVTP